MSEPWIGPRQDRWTDILPESWQSAINTSPTINALARYLNRPSFEAGVKEWQDSIPGNSPIDRIADKKSTFAQEFPTPMNPLGQSLLDTGGFLANFIGPGAKVPPAAASSRPQGIRAYHGSPHDFDRFDISKIGTGEGAQAYGRGLYFAENENVADAYRRVLGYKAANPERKLSYDPDVIAQSEMNYHLHNGRTPDEARTLAVERLNIGAKSYATTNPDEWHVQKGFDDFPRLSDAYRQAAERLASNQDRRPGHMYEVRINADPETFLDWDKPLSQQPEAVKRALQKSGVALDQAKPSEWVTSGDTLFLGDQKRWPEPFAKITPQGSGFSAGVYARDGGASKYFTSLDEAKQFAQQELAKRGDTRTGRDAYLDLEKRMQDPESVRKALLESDVSGIRYADALSRTWDPKKEIQGTRNVVVFDDKMVEILRKYGLLPPVAAGAAQALSQGQDTAY